MPDTKASALVAATVFHSTDLLIGVDVTDTTMAASGTTKRFSPAIVLAGLPIFGASGGGHAIGIVPDPGASAGTTRYLREDATWFAPPGGGGGTPGGSTTQIQYNNAGAFGGLANWAVGSSGQITGTAIPDPGSPAAGDLWISSGQSVLSFLDSGLVTRATGIIWQGLSPGTAISNTTSLLSIFAGIGTQQGSLTIPANSMKIGKCFRFHIFGTVLTTANPTIAIQIMMGANIIMQGTSAALTPNTGPFGWYMQTPLIQVQVVGASGKAIACGTVALFNLGTLSMGASVLNGPPAQVPIDTTTNLTFDIKMQWSAASPSNTIQFLGGLLEVFG